ncbi:Rieske 2Fe-2S domain-containing protein [Cryobacterium tepidiphilum]|uniref:(2Fe-2S)-binding protein n=1 Tax=Cryobacterium tepidiphilum TaxID=2486026 RepID=A0A3M8KWZ8_9MICO|nr:Rieske 2Fe-2S domain-containing protein [Cryobacterium tepidiphilum]RNE56992.1 (2Fe-2S)-binding protein [Cryobacterium tepidiphilum]
MKVLPGLKQVERLEDAAWLDPLAKPLRRVARAALRTRWLADILHGVPFGHPLHPSVVLVPIGAWSSAAILDALPENERASRLLVAAGVAGAVPSALSGYADWSNLLKKQSRVGLVHAASNFTAVLLYTASFVQRSRGRQGSGKVLGYAGFGAVMVGGFLGGHLAYRQTAGVNHTWNVAGDVSPGWHRVGMLDELPEGRLRHLTLHEVPLVALRTGNRVQVLADTCSHLTGPLHEGTLIPGTSATDACVQCPWHKSVFSLATGEVVHGPATAPQPCFETRITDGAVEVRLPAAG